MYATTMTQQLLSVFVSSVMACGQLEAERKQAVAAIKSVQLTVPWDFAQTPAASASPNEISIREVKRCDIFVLLVDNSHTEPVDAELSAAMEHQKPVLAFVKNRARLEESKQRRELLNRLSEYKYREFKNPDDLYREVREAIRYELTEGYRKYRLTFEDAQKISSDNEESVSRIAVREATKSDDKAIRDTLMELKQWYPNIEPWITDRTSELGKADDLRVAEVGGTIAGISISRDKERDVRKLATLYVRPTSQGAAIGPHLVREEVLRAARDRMRKTYVTFADELAERIKPILEQSGFVTEGASRSRYRDGSTEWVMGKTFVYDEIESGGFHDFVRKRMIIEPGGAIESEEDKIITARLPRFPTADVTGNEPPEVKIAVSIGSQPEHEYQQYQDRFSGQTQKWVFVSMLGKPAEGPYSDTNWIDGADISARFYPVTLVAPEQRALVVTIQPSYADALIPNPMTPRMLPPTRLQLRPDNVYYRAPSSYRGLRRGSRIFFYVSDPHGFERGSVRGCGIITGTCVGTPEECFEQYRSKGVFDYNDLHEIAQNNNGKVLAIAFDWYDAFRRRVGLEEMRRAVKGYDPRAARQVSFEESQRIIRSGRGRRR